MSLTEISVRGVRKPVVRYVYLVQDLSDAARMGGTSDNTYTTYQTAYNAADALQLLVGGVVIILIGNITNTAAGSCSTPTWNPNVHLQGINSIVSRVGSTVITTATPITIRVNGLGLVGGITAEGGISINIVNSQVLVGTLNTSSATGNGGTLVVTGSNSNVSNLNTQSTAGNSGNITLVACSNLQVGGIFQTSSVGNVGSLSFTTVNNTTVGTITRTATSAVNNTTIGDFGIGNSENIIFQNAITISITNPLSTGTINVYIGRSNQSIMFSNTVNILGCTTSARSDVGLDLQFINCVFNNALLVNTTGTFISERGGWIKRLDMQDCKFFVRARFVNWPINPQTTDPLLFGLTVTIKDCSFFPLSAFGGGVYFQNNDVGYSEFLIKDCESNDTTVGISLGTNIVTPPVIPWMIDNEYIDYQNVKAYISIQTYDPVLNPAPYCAILNNCNGGALILDAYEDFNFQVNMCNYDYVGYQWGHGALPLTRPWYINNSRMGAGTGGGNFSFNWGGIGGPLDLIIKNSYFGFYTDVLNPQIVSIPAAYNSFIESISDVGSTSTYTGTLFTSTIRRLVTEVVVGLTLNNSYDDAY